jgi:hypothetical protein
VRRPYRFILPIALGLFLAIGLPPGSASININVDAVQKTVVFLYAATASGDAVDSNHPIGTGFFVEIPLKSDPKHAYRVLVTARHMVDPTWAKCPTSINPTAIYARLNKKAYDPNSDKTGVDFIRIDLQKDGKPTWVHHKDDDVDAAVVPAQVDDTVFDTTTVPITFFPTDEEIKSQSIGDLVMSAGLLPGLQGKSRNYPIFKFGQISSIPAEDVETHCANGSPAFSVKVWLIAANLVPGNSGSPIFHVPLGGSGVVLGGTRAMLLGVQSISDIAKNSIESMMDYSFLVSFTIIVSVAFWLCVNQKRIRTEPCRVVFSS